MRIYLACTVRGNRSALGAARAIAHALRASGHDIITAHLLDDDVDTREARLTEREVFQRDLGWLDSCDVLVAEASGSSFGVGFEVGYVLGRSHTTKQRVVLVYEASRASAVSRLIAGATHPKCATLAYRNEAELLAFVAERVEGLEGSERSG